MKLIKNVQTGISKLKKLAISASIAMLSLSQLNCPVFAQLATAPNDPYFVNNQLWSLAFYQVPVAWEKASGKGMRVAVLANGVDDTCQDLVGKVVYKGGSRTPTSLNQNKEGTIMAALIAGIANNGTDGVGIAPDAEILDIKILEGAIPDRFTANQTTALVNGIREAKNNGAKIIVLPFKSALNNQFSQTDRDRVDLALEIFHMAPGQHPDAAGGLVFMPAGDDNTRERQLAMYPHIIVVSGYNRMGQQQNSGRGTQIKWSANQTGQGWEPGAITLSATRYAAAEAAGVAALVWSYNRAVSNTEVERTITSTCFNNNQGWNSNTGWGVLHAADAINATPKPSSAYQPYAKIIKPIDINLPDLIYAPRTTATPIGF